MSTTATGRPMQAWRAWRLEEYDHLAAYGISLEEIARRVGIRPKSLRASLRRRRRDAR